MFCFFRRNKLTCRIISDTKDEERDHIYKSNCDEAQVFHELKGAHQLISSCEVENTLKRLQRSIQGLILEKQATGFSFNCVW